MAKKAGAWSMEDDRILIALSKTLTLEAIADMLQRKPESILRSALRLGVTIKRKRK